jgi:tetratricopeptide (TPR) repeat protein
MEQAGYRHDWIAYLEQGVAQSRVLKDLEAEPELCFHLGVLYHHQGRLPEARRQFEHNQDSYRAAGDAFRQGRALNRLAQITRSEGHLEEAADHAWAALELVQTDPVESGFTHMVLGTIFYDRREWDRCVDHFQTSLALWEMDGDPRRVAFGLSNLGTGLRGQNSLVEAARCYARAIELLALVGDPVHEAAAQLNLGNILLMQERYGETVSLLREAEATLLPRRDPIRLAPLYNNLGMALQQLERWDEGRRSYEASLSNWQQVGNIASLVNTLDNLGTLYLDQEQYHLAATTFQQALSYLEQMEQDKPRAALQEMVMEHLVEAQARQTDLGRISENA